MSEQRRTPTSSSPHSPLASHSNKSTKERPFRNLGDRTMKNPRQNTRTQRPVPEGGGGLCSFLVGGRRQTNTPDPRPPAAPPASRVPPTPHPRPVPTAQRAPARQRPEGPPGGGGRPCPPAPSPQAPGSLTPPLTRHLHLGPPPRGNLGRRPSLPAGGEGEEAERAGGGRGGARPAAGRVGGDKAHRLATRPHTPAPPRHRGRPDTHHHGCSQRSSARRPSPRQPARSPAARRGCGARGRGGARRGAGSGGQQHLSRGSGGRGPRAPNPPRPLPARGRGAAVEGRKGARPPLREGREAWQGLAGRARASGLRRGPVAAGWGCPRRGETRGAAPGRGGCGRGRACRSRLGFPLCCVGVRWALRRRRRA